MSENNTPPGSNCAGSKFMYLNIPASIAIGKLTRLYRRMNIIKIPTSVTPAAFQKFRLRFTIEKLRPKAVKMSTRSIALMKIIGKVNIWMYNTAAYSMRYNNTYITTMSQGESNNSETPTLMTKQM